MFTFYLWWLGLLLLNSGSIQADGITEPITSTNNNNTIVDAQDAASTRTNILVVKEEDDSLFEEGSTGSTEDSNFNKNNIQFVFPQNATDYTDSVDDDDDDLSGSSGDEETRLEYTGEILGSSNSSSSKPNTRLGVVTSSKANSLNHVTGSKGNSLNPVTAQQPNVQNVSEEENEDVEDDEDESEEKEAKGKFPVQQGESPHDTPLKDQPQQKISNQVGIKSTNDNRTTTSKNLQLSNPMVSNVKQPSTLNSTYKEKPSTFSSSIQQPTNRFAPKPANLKATNYQYQQAPDSSNSSRLVQQTDQMNTLPNFNKPARNDNLKTPKNSASNKYIVITADVNNKTKTIPLNQNNNNNGHAFILPNSTNFDKSNRHLQQQQQQQQQQSMTNTPTHGTWKTVDVSKAMLKQNNVSSSSTVNYNRLSTPSNNYNSKPQNSNVHSNQFNKNGKNIGSISHNAFTNSTIGANSSTKPSKPGLNLAEHLNHFVAQKSVSKKKVKQRNMKHKVMKKKLNKHVKKFKKQKKRKVNWTKKQRKSMKNKKKHNKAKKREKKTNKNADSPQPPKKIPESDYKEINVTEDKNKGNSTDKEQNETDNGSANGEDNGKSESSSQLSSKEKENNNNDAGKVDISKTAPEKDKQKDKEKEDEKNSESDESEGSGHKAAGKENDGKESHKTNEGEGHDDKEPSTGEASKDNGKIKLGNSNKGEDKNETNNDNDKPSTTETKKDDKEKSKEEAPKGMDKAPKEEKTQPFGGGDKERTAGQNERTKDLQQTLSRIRFMNGASGKVHTGQQFSYISQCGLYTEPQNVSLAQHSWVTKTYSPYFYLYEKPKDYEKCKPSDWLFGKDMRGSVFLSFEVKSLHGSNLTNNAKICEKYCCKEPRCQAWVVRFQDSATNNCPDKSFCCWLKNDVPPVEDYYLEDASVAGIVHRKNYRHPPTGMRSAVPLGGLGAGSFEMRADGTFHEWTIENQSPGGSAKLSKAALEKMFLGVRVQTGGATARSAIMRTHSMKEFENETVKSLEYFGAHPVSKFAIEMNEEKTVEMNLYAFSPFHPRDAAESATPAVSFSLEVHNPSDEDLEVSFMLNIPFGYNEDTVRKGGNYQEADFTRAVTPADCQRECAKRTDCQSWTTNGPNTCILKDTIPLHSYDYGIVSGIRGDWDVKEGMLNCQRPGDSPQSGDITMYPLQSGTEDQSFVVTDNISSVWTNFKKYGQLNGNSTHTMKLNKTGLHGATSVTTKLKPKETKLLTIIFAWYFPNKDIADERVGNFYTNLFKSSSEVAKHFESDLLSTATDTLNWHSSVFTPTGLNIGNNKTENVTDVDDFIKNNDNDDNSNPRQQQNKCDTTVDGVSTLPVCLQDMLVNSMSFLRTAMWFENGRWRQWETFDCANLDPVHIDFHRIIPYIIFYPDLVKQLMFSWADHQLTNLENGMIQESLSQGCLEETSREGSAGGRQMTDVNVGFISQAYMVYKWTNDTEFFDQIYPFARRATHWLIHRATKGSGLPYRKPDAYDLFELEKYDHSAYNSVLYLLALKAMKKMAGIKKDAATVEDVDKALERAQKLFEVEMWDQRKGFYHAWFDDEWGSPNWLMSDILYGQVWSYTLGLGDLLDTDKMKKHLRKEVGRNDSPYGLKVLTKNEDVKETEDTSIILGEESNSCKSLENITKTHSVWMSSSTDWSTLQLHLGMNPEKAMDQAIKSLDNYRSTLRDQWNIHGMTSSSHYGLDGLPWATSHYTLHLVLWHLPLALSGQQYSAPEGKITFDPKYSPPYWLPFYTPSCMGNIEAKETSMEKNSQSEIMYTMNVSSGRCKFNELRISKSKYDGLVNLGEGDTLSWSVPKNSQEDKIQSLLDQLKKH